MKNKLQIYYKALEIAERADTTHIGLCHFLTDAICQVEHNLFLFVEDRDRTYIEEEINTVSGFWRSVKAAVEGNNSMFPEIAKHRPIDYRTFWFPLDDRISRIVILKQAIVEYKIELYSKALEYLINDETPVISLGFCHAITEAICQLEYDTTLEKSDAKVFHPVWNLSTQSVNGLNPFMQEFIKYKPESAEEYWFPGEDRQIRIDILKEIIQNLQNEK